MSPGLVFHGSVGNSADNIAEAASHELGHNLYLAHDGTSTLGYYEGHGSGNTVWAPIMGVGYNAQVTQWSKGEYSDANNTEDDLSRITNYIPYDTDDHNDTDFSLATPLQIVSSTVTATNPVNDSANTNLANKGVIENRTDRDLFFMDAGPGLIDLDITPAWIATYASGDRGANLDIQATLYDEFGNQLVQNNPVNDTNANINYEVTTPARFYLEIDGVGKGTTSDGYSDYGSIGQYFINGTVPDYVIATASPIAPTDLSATLVNVVSIDLDWTDETISPESNEAGYRVLRSIDGGAYLQIANLPRDSQSYSDNNLSDGDFSYKLELYNSFATVQSTSTFPITLIVPSVAVANSESSSAGSIQSGSYASTQAPSNSETLLEQHNGGRPANRVSSLDHTWTIPGVVSGASVTLFIEALAPGNNEGEDFQFSYTLNNGPAQTIGTLENGTGIQQFSVNLPTVTAGTIRVNVVDTDRSQGNKTTDQVTVYQLMVTSIGDVGDQTPLVNISEPIEGASFEVGEVIFFTASANDIEDGDISSNLVWDSDPSELTGSNASIITSSLPIGSYVINASVSDSTGNIGSDAINITISSAINDIPVVIISSPGNGGSSEPGETVSFTGSANDEEDGDISGLLNWSSNIDGIIGAGINANTSSLSQGVHTITAEATDSGGLSGSVSIIHTISVPSTATSVSVKDIDGVGVPTGNGGKWQAQVTIEIRDDEGTLIEGALMSGNWSTNGNSTCTTLNNGRCTVSKGGLKKSNASVSFSVTNVSNTLTYVPDDNDDSDSDSDGNIITIVAP